MQIVLQRVQHRRRPRSLVPRHDEHDDGDQQQDDGGQHGDDDTDKVRLRFLIDRLRRNYCKKGYGDKERQRLFLMGSTGLERDWN